MQTPLFMLAAACLKEALEEGVALQAAAHEGPPIITSLASSGALARLQILLFLSVALW